MFDGGGANDVMLDILLLSSDEDVDDDDTLDLFAGALGRYETVGGIAGELRPLLDAPPIAISVTLMFPIELLFLW